jgi:hypothetical protein
VLAEKRTVVGDAHTGAGYAAGIRRLAEDP